MYAGMGREAPKVVHVHLKRVTDSCRTDRNLCDFRGVIMEDARAPVTWWPVYATNLLSAILTTNMATHYYEVHLNS